MTLETWFSTIPNASLAQLRAADARWQQLRTPSAGLPPATVVRTADSPLGKVTWDVLICGGTLGIFIGAALAQQGFRVAVLERGVLQGRSQEWNTSRQELQTLVHLGLLTPAQLDTAIVSDFNPNRIAFKGGPEFWVEDVLNIGVDPVYLLDCLKQKFLALGGQLLEHTAFTQAVVHPDGVQVNGKAELTARLLIDGMGHGSPLVAQARQGQRPQSVCLVVGTCAQGIPRGTAGDLMVSLTGIENGYQGFWEAFPARDGRTTYLFTYADLHPTQPSLEQLFELYLRELPDYQQVAIADLDVQRVLFGLFPSYTESPLAFPWPRTLAIGDSSGCQSPLSFGGFGAMLRHLSRLSTAIQEALQADCLEATDLALVQPYQPNLSVTWLFQKSMSVGGTQILPSQQINTLLSAVFQAMNELGADVLRPFLQDVVQFGPLYQTLVQVSLQAPGLIPKILQQVGPGALVTWMGHFAALGTYRGLHQLQPLLTNWSDRLPPPSRYRWHRRLEAWAYGTGLDAE